MKTQAEAFDWISVLRESKRKKKKRFARIEEGLSAGRDQETLGRELIRRPDDDLSIFNFFFVCVGV